MTDIKTTTVAPGPRAGTAPPQGSPSAPAAAAPADTFQRTPAAPPLTMQAALQLMPKVDLHRHLEGCITPEIMLAVADKYGIPLPTRDVEKLRPYLQVGPQDKTLLDFLKKFDTIGLAFKNPAAIQDITQAVIRDAAKDNEKYVELRFSPLYMAGASHLDLHDVMNAVVKGTEAGSKETGTKVKLIVIVEREMGEGPAKVAEHLAEEYQDRGVVALDLANDEFHYPPGPYAKVFQEAHQAGLRVTVHAGEAGGPENVRTAIEQLDADRIGHGVRTYQDPAVEALVKERGTPLEMCPTSNIQTGAVASFAQHPLPRFYREGIDVTINTDDPAVSGITLSHDYQVAQQKWGLSLHDLENIDLNGVRAAFLPDNEKQALVAEFKKEFAQLDARVQQ